MTSKVLVMWSKAKDFAQGNSDIASPSAYPRKPDPSSLAPPCSLKRLNEEYRKLLLVHRRQVSLGAPAVRFDPDLFQGCYEFNQLLERTNVLRHEPDQPGAEIAGVSTAPLVRDDAPALARFIWTQFAASPQHAAIQADPSLTLVAVTSCAHYFLVRFKSTK